MVFSSSLFLCVLVNGYRVCCNFLPRLCQANLVFIGSIDSQSTSCEWQELTCVSLSNAWHAWLYDSLIFSVSIPYPWTFLFCHAVYGIAKLHGGQGQKSENSWTIIEVHIFIPFNTLTYHGSQIFSTTIHHHSNSYCWKCVCLMFSPLKYYGISQALLVRVPPSLLTRSHVILGSIFQTKLNSVSQATLVPNKTSLYSLKQLSFNWLPTRCRSNDLVQQCGIAKAHLMYFFTPASFSPPSSISGMC